MNFQFLLPALLLFSIPLILLLWLLKIKAKSHPVSSLFLWKEACKNTQASHPWEKFKNHLLMYIQIAAAAALVVALMAPYIPGAGHAADTAVIAMDISGSMNIRTEDGRTRFELAKTAAKKYISDLPEDVPVAVITFSSVPSLGMAASADRARTMAYLEDLEPVHTSEDISACVDYIRSFTENMPNTQTAVFTDWQPQGKINNVQWFSFWESGTNGAISYVTHTQTEDKAAVLVNVTNMSAELYETDVSLYIDDTFTDVAAVSLKSYESQAVYFEIPADSGQVLCARLSSNDALPEDNVAYDLMEAAAEHKVLLISEQNIFLEKALIAAGKTQLYKTSDEEMASVADGDFDTIIYDGYVPETIPKTGNLIFMNPLEGTLENVSMSASDCEMNAYIYPFDLSAVKASALPLPDFARPLFQSGENVTAFYGYENGRLIVVLGFDIHDTQLPLLPEFPVFIKNMIDLCAREPLLSQSECNTGEALLIQWPEAAKTIHMRDPKGQENLLTREHQVTPELEYSGLYTFVQKTEAGSEETAYAISRFPVDRESDMSPKTVTVTDASGNPDGDTALDPGMDLRPLVIAVCIALLLLEWLVYLRRL